MSGILAVQGLAKRFGGLKAARLKLAPDFHAPLRDEDLLGT